MTRAGLRSYLSLVPLFKHLPRDEQSAIAKKLVRTRLARGETLDLRGCHAQVLCIVTRSKVKIETYLSGDHVRRSKLAAGQWTGQALLIGWSQALRMRLAADGRDAEILLLWQQDLIAIPVFKNLVGLSQSLSFLYHHSKSIIEGVKPKAANGLELLSSRALKYPIAAGAFIALTFFIGLLLFTQPGKSLRADWGYLRLVHRGHLSQERQARQLSRILFLAPNHPSAIVELGNMAAQADDFDTAIMHYTAVAHMSGAGANNLGVLLLKQGDPEKALQAITQSMQMEPDVAATYQNLGIAFQQLGQERAAIRSFKEALWIDPSLTVARYHLGMHYLGQGALVEAGSAFGRVLEQDPTSAPAHLGLGLVQMGIGDLERAAHAFEQATQLEPSSAVAHFYLGWAQAEMGDKVEAEATLTRVLQLQSPPDLLERVHAMLGEGANNAPKEVPMSSGP